MLLPRMKKIRLKKKRILPDMGERLLDFAKPLLDAELNVPALEGADARVEIAVAIWNAYSARKTDSSLLKKTITKQGIHQSVALNTVVQGLARRRRDFDVDMRLVLSHEVVEAADGLKITAKSRQSTIEPPAFGQNRGGRMR